MSRSYYKKLRRSYTRRQLFLRIAPVLIAFMLLFPFQASPPSPVFATSQSAEAPFSAAQSAAASVEATSVVLAPPAGAESSEPSKDTTEAPQHPESPLHSVAKEGAVVKATQTVVVTGDLSGTYDTLTAAITDLNNHGKTSYTVTVAQNETVTNLTIKKKIHLSSAAGTTVVINNAVGSRHFTVDAGAELTLKDITLQGSTQTTGNTAAGGINVLAQGQLVIEAGTTIKGVAPANIATASMQGGAVLCAGTCVMNGGALTGNKISVPNGTGAGVYVSGTGASFTLNAGSISNNSASNGVGVACAAGAAFTMNGGTISGNTSAGVSSFGVGVRILEANSSFKMLGGAISKNVSSSSYGYGGGVAVMQGKPSFVLQGGTISDNKVASEGGGVFIADGSVTLNSGAINDNSAGEGGGVYVSQNGTSTFQMNGGAINGNSATVASSGGVFLGPQANFTFKNGEICNNSAASVAGGVVIFGYNTLTLSNMKLDGNRANDTGGAVFLPHTSTLIASDTVFSNNFAKVDGGAIHSTMGGDYKNLDLAASVRFFLNTSTTAYPPRADAQTYFPKIKTTSSSIYNHPVNNYDINYMEGTPGVVVTVRYIDRDGRAIGDPSATLYAMTKNSSFTLTAEQIPQIPHYTFAAWKQETNGALQTNPKITLSSVTANTTLFLIFDEIPEIDVAVPVKMIFAAFQSDKGEISAPAYYLLNRGQTPVEVKLTSFTVDASANLVLTSEPAATNELGLKFQGIGASSASLTTGWLVPGAPNKALGTLAEKGKTGSRKDFTLSGHYVGGFFAPKTPRYFATFEFAASL
ncbi:MAG: MucBP domain-containing protein [Actinomycetia bacterium]|nr:MucBP domain-containing protein [Actinomycetes bacterium]